MNEGVLNHEQMTLRQRREARKYPRSYVAEICNVSHGTVRNWEERVSRPGDHLLELIAGLYGLPVGELKKHLKPETPFPKNRKKAAAQ